MFFNNRRRLEEDLERIRQANLPPEALEAEEERRRLQKETQEAAGQDKIKLTAKDVLAMTIAILSIIVPYVLVIFAGIALVLFLFLR